MFLRREFWLKPAFFLGYAVIALAIGIGMVSPAAHDVLAQRAVDTGRICGSGVTSRCVEEVHGTMGAPHPQRRTVNVTRSVFVDGEMVAEIELGPSASDRLGRRSGAEIDAQVYNGRAVAVTNQNGETFHDL